METQISIHCLDPFPDIGLDQVKEDLQSKGLSVSLSRAPAKPYAAMEWIVPSAVCFFLAKAYFDGFLKEAGKDHYVYAKNAIKVAVDKARAVLVSLVTSAGEKKNKSYSQSQAVSIILKTKSNRTVKLLFDENLSKEDWEAAIDELFDYVIQNYETTPNDKFTQRIQDLKQHEAHWIYAIIDPQTKELVFHDDMSFYQSQKEKSKLTK